MPRLEHLGKTFELGEDRFMMGFEEGNEKMGIPHEEWLETLAWIERAPLRDDRPGAQLPPTPSSVLGKSDKKDVANRGILPGGTSWLPGQDSNLQPIG